MRDVYVAGVGITTFGRLEYPLSRDRRLPGDDGDARTPGSPRDRAGVRRQHGKRPDQSPDRSGLGGGRHLVAHPGRCAETIENGPASGASAIKQGFLAIASGMYDVVLVTGAERMREVNNLDATDFVATLTHPSPSTSTA